MKGLRIVVWVFTYEVIIFLYSPSPHRPQIDNNLLSSNNGIFVSVPRAIPKRLVASSAFLLSAEVVAEFGGDVGCGDRLAEDSH